jgi:hypothetical protein
VWTTVIALALALNFEPNRLGLIALLLIRPNPIRQLALFLSASFVVSAGAGLLALLVVDRGFLSRDTVNGAHVQIAVGSVTLAAAVVLASRFGLRTETPAGTTETAHQQGPSMVERLLARAGNLVNSRSPWFAVFLGMAIAIPSVDYLALLLLIATSGAPLSTQAGTLFAFLAIANVVLLVPILGHLVAPQRTSARLEQLRTWVLSRRRRDYALLMAFVGCLMIAVGIGRL